MKLRWLMILLLLSAVLPCHLLAAPALPGDAPLDISSRQLEADDAAKTVTFIGDVEARQADLIIYAGRLTVHYLGDSRQVERIDAEQDVRIVQGSRVATGQRAVYLSAKGEVLLTGNPRINDGSDFVSGDSITVYLNDKRSVVDSKGKGRVKATFHPKGGTNGADTTR